VSTDSLSHVHVGDGGTNMIETIYTIVQELTSAAVFLTECYDPPSRMPCGNPQRQFIERKMSAVNKIKMKLKCSK